MLVLFHGFMGMRTVIGDHVHAGRGCAPALLFAPRRPGRLPVHHRHAGGLHPPVPGETSTWARASARRARRSGTSSRPSSWAPAELDCGPPWSLRGRASSTAVLTKLYPTRSHTGAAQGGVCAALGNQEGGPLGVAHVRHRQGRRLPRSTRTRAEILAQEAIDTRHRARAHGPAASTGRLTGKHRPAPFRRPHPQLRRGASSGGRASRPTAPAT